MKSLTAIKWAKKRIKAIRKIKKTATREVLKRQRLSLKIFKRDKFTCRICGATDTELNAHHLVPYSHSPELRADPINMLTVCTDCHLKHCHNNDFHSINLDISVKYIIENLRRRRLVINRDHFIDYFSRYKDKKKFMEVKDILRRKRSK